MERIGIKLANIPIEAAVHHAHTASFLRGYACDGEPWEKLEITQKHIEAERATYAEQYPGEACAVSVERLELLALHRAVAEVLPRYDAAACHGSAFSLNGKGVLLSGESGAGKSTHARMWRERYGDEVLMINDDKPILRIENGEARLYGSPWMGKHALGTNISAPLFALASVRRAGENALRPLADDELWQALSSCIHLPSGAAEMLNTLRIMDRVRSCGARFFTLECIIAHSAAEAAREAFGI